MNNIIRKYPIISRGIALAILLFPLSSCENKSNIIEFKIKPIESLNLSEIFTVENVIKIKNDKPIPSIRKVLTFNGNLIAFLGGNIAEIDSEGNIIKKLINSNNKYLYKDLWDFDAYQSQIYVLERSTKKIKKIDKDFSIIDEYSLPVYALGFKILNDSICAIYSGFDIDDTNKYQLHIFNYVNGTTVKQYFNVLPNQKYFNFATSHNILANNIEKYFWNGMQNKIYNFDQNSINVKYEFDYGHKSMPENFYEDHTFIDVEEFVNQTNKMERITRFYRCLLFDKYALIGFSLGKERYYTFKNLTSLSEFTTKEVKDDILNTGNISISDPIDSFLPTILNNKVIIYRDNPNLEKDSSYVGSLIFGEFIF